MWLNSTNPTENQLSRCTCSRIHGSDTGLSNRIADAMSWSKGTMTGDWANPRQSRAEDARRLLTAENQTFWEESNFLSNSKVLRTEIECASISQKPSKQTFESHWIFENYWIFERRHFERFAAFAVYRILSSIDFLRRIRSKREVILCFIRGKPVKKLEDLRKRAVMNDEMEDIARWKSDKWPSWINSIIDIR
jgi:hypothetical protein